MSSLDSTLDANVINIAKKKLFMQMSSLDSTLDSKMANRDNNT
jgi:hypothetical protein